jgi:hypothetical protein
MKKGLLYMLPFAQAQGKLNHRDAAKLTALSAQQNDNKGQQVVANAPITQTAYAPDGVGTGLVNIGKSLGEAEDIRVVIDSDSATANTQVLIIGDSAVFAKAGTGWSSNGSVNVTIPDITGADTAAIFATQLKSNTLQITDLTIEASASASATVNVSAAQLYENILRHERGLSTGTKNDKIDVRGQRNPGYFQTDIVNVGLTVQQGLLNPLTCLAYPVFRAKCTVNLTLGIASRISGTV